MRLSKKKIMEMKFKEWGIPIPNQENSLQVDIEKHLKKWREKGFLDYLHLNGGKGGIAAKYQKTGEPDLIIYGEFKNTFFMELKSKIGKTHKEQDENIERKRDLGYKCYLVNDIERFRGIMNVEISAIRHEKEHEKG